MRYYQFDYKEYNGRCGVLNCYMIWLLQGVELLHDLVVAGCWTTTWPGCCRVLNYYMIWQLVQHMATQLSEPFRRAEQAYQAAEKGDVSSRQLVHQRGHVVSHSHTAFDIYAVKLKL